MQPPTHLLNNRYSVVRTIGQGGMGAVFEAVDTRLGNHVAVKQTLSAAPGKNTAFEHEARLLARLHHPVLPMVSDFFVDNGAQFIVMQYIPGDDLAMLLVQRGQPFPVADVLRWADTLLDALEYLHTQQPPVIHRDIKPHNLKLNGRGEIVLLDFGIAKGGTATSLLAKSVRAYTPHYAPLEQIQQMGTTASSDLYALGGTLHQLLTGYLAPSALERVAAKLNNLPDPYQAAHEVNPNVPPAIGAILSQALALNANDRYQSAQEMRCAIQRVAGVQPSPGVQSIQTSARFAAPIAAQTTTMGTTNATGATIALTPPPIQPTMLQSPRKRRMRLATPLIALRNIWMTPVTPKTPSSIWGYWIAANTLWVWVLITLGLLLGPFGPAVFFLVGIVSGLGQAFVLRHTEWHMVGTRWFISTAIAGPIALIGGIAIAMPFGLNAPAAWVLSGLLGGAIVGGTQWWAVRGKMPLPLTWIVAQSISWLLAICLCAVSIGFVLLVGLINGIIGGAVLSGLVRRTMQQRANTPLHQP